MKNLIKSTLSVCFCVLVLYLGVQAQAKAKPNVKKQSDSSGSAFLSGAGKVGVVVVGSAAKIAWGTTKFVAKDLAVPVATSFVKPIVVHAAPAAAKFALKKSAKYLLPFALKLSIL